MGDLRFGLDAGELGWRAEEGDLFNLARWEQGPFNGFLLFFAHPGIDAAAVVKQALELDLEDVALGKADDAVAHLADRAVGFGLCVWNEERAYLFRDPIGRLPLFWSRHGGHLEWGTYPPVLERYDGQPRQSQLKRYVLREEGHEREDFYQGIYRLRAGEVMSWRISQRRRPHFRSYWPGEIEMLDEGADIEQRLEDVLRQAVRRIGDQGARALSLSGGVDSTLLAALFVDEGYDIEAFSMVDPTSPEFHEEEQIRENCEALGIELHTFDIGRHGQWERPAWHTLSGGYGPVFIPQMAYKIPFGEFIKKRCDNSQVISGFGGDQIFHIYPNVFWLSVRRAKFVRMLPGFSLSGLMRFVFKRVFHSFSGNGWIARHTEKRVVGGYPEIVQKLDFVWRGMSAGELQGENRWTQFQMVTWEHSTRIMERLRRKSGVLYRCPFLSRSIESLAFSVKPTIARSAKVYKRPLRKTLQAHSKVSTSDRSGLFTEPVRSGLKEIRVEEEGGGDPRVTLKSWRWASAQIWKDACCS